MKCNYPKESDACAFHYNGICTREHNYECPALVKPTEKQIAYATYLAQRMCAELPKETTREAYSAFINKWKPAVAQEDQAMNEPSEWQLRYC